MLYFLAPSALVFGFVSTLLPVLYNMLPYLALTYNIPRKGAFLKCLYYTYIILMKYYNILQYTAMAVIVMWVVAATVDSRA